MSPVNLERPQNYRKLEVKQLKPGELELAKLRLADLPWGEFARWRYEPNRSGAGINAESRSADIAPIILVLPDQRRLTLEATKKEYQAEQKDLGRPAPGTKWVEEEIRVWCKRVKEVVNTMLVDVSFTIKHQRKSSHARLEVQPGELAPDLFKLGFGFIQSMVDRADEVLTHTITFPSSFDTATVAAELAPILEVAGYERIGNDWKKTYEPNG